MAPWIKVVFALLGRIPAVFFIIQTQAEKLSRHHLVKTTRPDPDQWSRPWFSRYGFKPINKPGLCIKEIWRKDGLSRINRKCPDSKEALWDRLWSVCAINPSLIWSRHGPVCRARFCTAAIDESLGPNPHLIRQSVSEGPCRRSFPAGQQSAGRSEPVALLPDQAQASEIKSTNLQLRHSSPKNC